MTVWGRTENTPLGYVTSIRCYGLTLPVLHGCSTWNTQTCDKRHLRFGFASLLSNLWLLENDNLTPKRLDERE